MSDVQITMALSGFDGVKNAFGGVEKEANKMASGVANASNATQTFGQRLSSLKGIVAGLGLGLVVAHVAKLEEAMEDTARAASRLGVAFEWLQKLELTAKRFGASAGAAEVAMKFFNRQIGEASLQPMGTAARLFNALGIEITDVNGEVRNSEALFRETVDALSQVGSKSEATKAIFALFGEQSGTLVDLFTGGTKTLDEFGDKLDGIGAIVGEHVAPTMRDANSIVYDFQDALEGATKKTIAGAILAFEDIGIAAAAAWKSIAGPSSMEKMGFDSGEGMLAGFKELSRLAQSPITLKGALDPRAEAEAAGALRKAEREAERFAEAMERVGEVNRDVTREMHEAWMQQQDDLRELATDLYADVITPLEAYEQKLLQVARASDKLGEAGVARVVDDINKKLAESVPAVLAVESAFDQLFDRAIDGGEDFIDILEDVGKQLGKDILKGSIIDPLKDSAKGFIGGLMGGGQGSGGEPDATQTVLDGFIGKLSDVFTGEKGLLTGLQSVFFGEEGVLGGMANIFTSAWDSLASIFTWLIGEETALAVFETAERWAVAIWETAERWAIAIFEAAAGLLGFESGGDLTVTRPTLIMVGEKNKAERVRVSPIAGGMSRGASRGFGGSPGGGGGAAVQVFIPQTSVVNDITAGAFARQIAQAVRRENGRTV